MGTREMKSMLRGALIFTIASFIAKILSAVYRIPYQNLVGNEGFYVYQQIYPFYGLAMTLSLNGLPVFLSKLVAETKDVFAQEKIMKQCFPYIFWLSAILFLGTFLGSGFLAAMMGDPGLAPLLRVIAFSFLLCPWLSFYRGNFQGNLWMTPTALSQIAEQLIRVAIIVLAALCFKYLHWGTYFTGEVAMTGGFFGGAAAFFILKQENRRRDRFPLVIHWDWLRLPKVHTILPRLLIEGTLISVYSSLLIFFQLSDSFAVKNALVAGGATDLAAKVLKGIFDRGQPLVQLGLVISLGMNAIFLPSLTKKYLQKGGGFFRSSRIFLRLVTALALAASCGMILLMPYINYFLFADHAGTGMLMIYASAVAWVSLIQAYQAILQSMDSYRPALWFAGGGILLKLVLTYPLTKQFGGVGASLATVAGLVLILLLLFGTLPKAVRAYWSAGRYAAKLALVLGLMVISLLLLNDLWYDWGIAARAHALVIALLGAFFGTVVFFAAAWQLKLFTLREWLMLPGFERIIKKISR